MFSLSKPREKIESSDKLDTILLSICLVGPLLLELLSIFGLIYANGSFKDPYWSLSLINSFVDIALSSAQVSEKQTCIALFIKNPMFMVS